MIWTILSVVWKPIAALLAILGIYAAGSRNARQKAKSEAIIEDFEHAESIRKRVADDRADRLRKHDDAGWRD
jgi:hypothetical protein